MFFSDNLIQLSIKPIAQIRIRAISGYAFNNDRSISLLANKYFVDPELMNRFFEALSIVLASQLQESGPLDIKFSMIKNVMLHTPVKYNGELKGDLVLHSFEIDDEIPNTWSFILDYPSKIKILNLQ